MEYSGFRAQVFRKKWECEIDEEILTRHSELKTHPVVRHSHLNTREALYGGRTEAMRITLMYAREKKYNIRGRDESLSMRV